MSIGRFLFIFLTEIASIIIVKRFSVSFLSKGANRFKEILAYSISVVITTCSYCFFNKAWLNTLSTLIGLSIISFSLTGTIKKRIIFILYVLSVSCIIDLIVYSFLVTTFDNNNYSELASLLVLFLMLIAQLFTRRFLSSNRERDIDNKHWFQYVSSLFICIITLLIVIVEKSFSSLSLSVVAAAFLLINLIIANLIDDIVDSSNKELENLILKEQIKSYERDIALQKEKTESLRAIKHDMKKHLAEISYLSMKDNNQLLKEYVNGLTNELHEVSPLIDSGNTSIDSVLNYMLPKAIENGISVKSKITIPKELIISMVDMNIVLGNLLENAIEANANVLQPKIDLTIDYFKGSLYIELSNTYKGNISFRHGYPVSSKISGDKHGYGIKNVIKVLEKYSYSFDIDCSSEIFCVRIIMNEL
ncbi:Sensor histidine kinase YesM [Pseudobutyrivibrio sp. UC1225]|uniref:sensor histidine kinase n=1 Tax=Pseudobutyrivibrio sp. UC1225 TaxID=1798185 RepID=UPI0008E2E171|nr:sensor histidine kinase [Pseudobutyrivibrio sp. UC1225]SFO30132.1 Sensor histidine kinase YesM [Pseudobutyrivibrio sp. UC1225]